MNEDFYLVHKSAVPEFFEKVLATKMAVETEGMSVSDACKKFAISRSTYYKYKDMIFYPDAQGNRKIILAFIVNDYPGVLSSILSIISNCGCNVLSINQNVPIQKLANINIMVDASNCHIDVRELTNQFKEIEYVKQVEVVAHE